MESAAQPGRVFYRVKLGAEIMEVDERYQKLRYIGGGAYGYVCAAEDRVRCWQVDGAADCVGCVFVVRALVLVVATAWMTRPLPNQVTSRRVAIKKIKDVFRDLVDAKRILREIKLLRHLCAHQVRVLSMMMMNMSSRAKRHASYDRTSSGFWTSWSPPTQATSGTCILSQT